jgi:nitrous-oxide reductase
MRRFWYIAMIVVLLVGSVASCGRDEATPTPEAAPAAGNEGAQATGALPASALQIAQERGLTPDDIDAALMTYTPSGKMDEYISFMSGGHSGNIIAVGVPSMRIQKNIAVFTPEAWQGYGYGSNESRDVLNAGNVDGVEIRMGDTHHPALSETAGDYDGQFLFINDKASARVAVIDLRDFETKQIVKDPNLISNHGSTFVTPNTEYIAQGSQYGTPLGWDYAPLSEYKEKYRGLITLWKFDREKGRIDPAQSFSIEVPPYWQDLCDAGKLVSDGWASAIPLTLKWRPAALKRATHPLKPASANGIWTICIFSTGARPKKSSRLAKLKPSTALALSGSRPPSRKAFSIWPPNRKARMAPM